MRRCGKSYLLFNLFKDYLISEGIEESHIIEIAFDAYENKQFRDPDVLYLSQNRSKTMTCIMCC